MTHIEGFSAVLIDDIELFWDEILGYVEERSVIPVIGPDLAVVDYEGVRQPYQRLLARRLAEHLDIFGLTESPTLNEVACAWLARPGAKRQSLYRELGKLSERLLVDIPEPLRQLARINDLRLFTSLCPDDLLIRALNEERYGGSLQTLERAFTPNETADLPENAAEGSLVYQLFGRTSILPKYVLAEDDVIEWISALQVPEKRPARLFDKLGSNHLLFLGCDFPDWLARFILRTTKNNRLSAERDFGEYLVDGSKRETDSFVVFLNSFSRGTQVLQLDAISFVAEFEHRWRERQSGRHLPRDTEQAPMPENAPPGSLFISYASEDRPAALKLASELQAAGLPVWLDRQQLDWGNDYNARIRLAVQQCALFIPLLSRTAELKLGFFRKEWNWAIERNREFTGASVEFLFPLVIDDAPVTNSPEVPAAFKETHIESAPGGNTSDSQRAAITKAWHAMQARQGRSS